MRYLIVGAGVVGRVFGYHLQQAGADVSFLIRPQHTARLKNGFELYRWQHRRTWTQIHASGFGLVTSVDAVGEQLWDFVMLCVSSPALKQPNWLRSLIDKIGQTTLVATQPGLDDPAFVRSHIADARLIWGMVAMLGYWAPLAEETFPVPGPAYWIPPLSRFLFNGPPTTTLMLVQDFKRGGLPAARSSTVETQIAIGGTLLEPLMVVLQCAGWSMKKLAKSPDLCRLAVDAAAEARAIVAARRQFKPPAALALVRPGLLRLLTHLAPKLTPFDLEAYLKAHYTKVHAQTAASLNTLIGDGGQVVALRKLREQFQACRS